MFSVDQALPWPSSAFSAPLREESFPSGKPLTMRAVPSLSGSKPMFRTRPAWSLVSSSLGPSRTGMRPAASTIYPVISFGFIVKRGRILAQRRGARRVVKAKQNRALHSTEIIEEPKKWFFAAIRQSRSCSPGFFLRALCVSARPSGKRELGCGWPRCVLRAFP